LSGHVCFKAKGACLLTIQEEFVDHYLHVNDAQFKINGIGLAAADGLIQLGLHAVEQLRTN
jgi:hypothetical protein